MLLKSTFHIEQRFTEIHCVFYILYFFTLLRTTYEICRQEICKIQLHNEYDINLAITIGSITNFLYNFVVIYDLKI